MDDKGDVPFVGNPTDQPEWRGVLNGEFIDVDEEKTDLYEVTPVGHVLREAADFVDKTEHFMGPNSVEAVIVFRRFDGSWGWQVTTDSEDYDDDA